MGGYAAVSSGRVLECVRELVAQGQPATREAVVRLSGLKKVVVDDRLRALVIDEKLRRTSRGVYELVEQYKPPRKMSKTILADGYVEIVVGDEVLLLSPPEDRRLAELLAGAATSVVAAGVAQQQQQALGELVWQSTTTQRDVRQFSHTLACAAGMMQREMKFLRNALARKGEKQARIEEREGVQPALCLRPKVQKLEDSEHGNSGEEGSGESGEADAPEGAAAGRGCAQKDAGKSACEESGAGKSTGKNARRKKRRQETRAQDHARRSAAASTRTA